MNAAVLREEICESLGFMDRTLGTGRFKNVQLFNWLTGFGELQFKTETKCEGKGIENYREFERSIQFYSTLTVTRQWLTIFIIFTIFIYKEQNKAETV